MVPFGDGDPDVAPGSGPWVWGSSAAKDSCVGGEVGKLGQTEHIAENMRNGPRRQQEVPVGHPIHDYDVPLAWRDLMEPKIQRLA